MSSRPFTFPPPPPPPPPTNTASTYLQNPAQYTQSPYHLKGTGYGSMQPQNVGQGRGNSGRGRAGELHFQSRGAHGLDRRGHGMDRGTYGEGRANYRGGRGFPGRGGQQRRHYGPNLIDTSNSFGIQQTYQHPNFTPATSYNKSGPHNQLQISGPSIPHLPNSTIGYETQTLPRDSNLDSQNAQINSQPQTGQNSFSSSNSSKRPHSMAFSNSPHSNTRPKAPPAIPSFGFNPLPAKPPTPSTESRSTNGNKRKKPRNSNQLGLTPHSQDPEVSSEDDAGEEAKLATGQGQGLQFTHRGRTCMLTNDKELREWLAERKRRFPTLARREAALKEAAERKQKWEEEKQKRNEERVARQEAEKARRQEFKSDMGKSNARRKKGKGRRGNLESVEEKVKDRSTQSSHSRSPKTFVRKNAPGPLGLDPSHPSSTNLDSEFVTNVALDAVTKAKLRAEKFRRKALKEEAKARKAEAKVLAVQKDYDVARKQNVCLTEESFPVDNRNSGGTSGMKEETDLDVGASKIFSIRDAALLTPTSPTEPLDPIKNEEASSEDEDDDSTSLSSSSTDPSALDSLTDVAPSSQCSTSSDSDIDSDSDSSEASGPESHPLHPTNPIRVPPPPRKSLSTDTKHTPIKLSVPICHQFRRFGRCNRGQECRYSHDIPQKSVKQERRSAQEKRDSKRRTDQKEKQRNQGRERRSLYQVLVEKEEEEERQRMLAAICWVGERGMLNGPVDEEGGQQAEERVKCEDKLGEAHCSREIDGTTMKAEKEDAEKGTGPFFAVNQGEENQIRTKTEQQPLAADLMVAAAAAAPP